MLRWYFGLWYCQFNFKSCSLSGTHRSLWSIWHTISKNTSITEPLFQKVITFGNQTTRISSEHFLTFLLITRKELWTRRCIFAHIMYLLLIFLWLLIFTFNKQAVFFKEVIILTCPETEIKKFKKHLKKPFFNPFPTNVPLLYPLKTSENQIHAMQWLRQR